MVAKEVPSFIELAPLAEKGPENPRKVQEKPYVWM
jgi:hypothetical protein